MDVAWAYYEYYTWQFPFKRKVYEIALFFGTNIERAAYIFANKTFDHDKHEIEQFTYNVHALGKMKGMSDEQVLEHFKEAFPPKLRPNFLK